MLCIIVRSALQKTDWRGRKMGETLGFHFKKKTVNVQTTFYLSNNLPDSEENYLYILHPGNVDFELITDTPFPPHRDEKDYNLLESLYSQSCKYDPVTKKLIQVRALSSWDDWQDYSKEEFERVNWPGDLENKPPIVARKSFPDENLISINKFSPFSICKVGPFTKNGAVLFSLNIRLNMESFIELVDRGATFTIDGPQRMLSRIKHCYIPKIDDSDFRNVCINELSKFEDFLKAAAGYDIVVLGEKFADLPVEIDKSYIEEALIQLPRRDYGVRYITNNCNFTMELCRNSEKEIREYIRNYKPDLRKKANAF
jgi:hypothetical protein